MERKVVKKLKVMRRSTYGIDCLVGKFQAPTDIKNTKLEKVTLFKLSKRTRLTYGLLLMDITDSVERVQEIYRGTTLLLSFKRYCLTH